VPNDGNDGCDGAQPSIATDAASGLSSLRRMSNVWHFPDASQVDGVPDLARELGITSSIAGLLMRLGLVDIEMARRFLFPKLRELSNPFEIRGMDKTVDRILQAIDRRERIVLYGDYDVDGITSVALLVRLLHAYNIEARPFLPHRIEEGYGLTEEGVERCLTTLQPQLLIALDCGTTAADRISRIEGNGIDVIVIDHHEARNTELSCCAFVNPKALQDGYHYLCTAGLVFKVCHALLKKRMPAAFDLKRMLDLVAIGTVADLVPLTAENRTLVHHGLRQLGQTDWVGLRALMEVSGVERPVRSDHVAFRLAPRLNAAGRLGIAQDALALLLTDDVSTAAELARRLDFQNRDRQSLEQKTLEEALEQVNGVPALDNAIVVGGKGWHPGVVGIVASRLMKRFHRPAIVVGFDESGDGRGSCRSIPSFSIIHALGECSEHLGQFGGHEMAAGLQVSFEQFDSFAEKFQKVAQSLLTTELLERRLQLDAELTDEEVDLQLLACHELLQPFGIGNPQPLFFIRGAIPIGQPRLLKEKHRSFTIRHRNRFLNAIHFHSASIPLPPPPWDLAFYLEENRYRNELRLQLQIEAIRSSVNRV
jgi:single-stranded-DNA-specific exonuclease